MDQEEIKKRMKLLASMMEDYLDMLDIDEAEEAEDDNEKETEEE